MAFIIKWMIGFNVAAIMVTCLKCETKNEEDATYCVKCGAKLESSREESWDEKIEKWGENFGKHAEEWGEDFGKRAEEWGKDFGREAEKDLINFGVIFGLFIGVILIIVAIAWIAGIQITQYFGLFLVIFGLLILFSAIYSLFRRR